MESIPTESLSSTLMKRRRNIIFLQCPGPPLLFMQIFGLLHLRRLSGTQPHYHNHSYAASRELIKCGLPLPLIIIIQIPAHTLIGEKDTHLKAN